MNNILQLIDQLRAGDLGSMMDQNRGNPGMQLASAQASPFMNDMGGMENFPQQGQNFPPQPAPMQNPFLHMISNATNDINLTGNPNTYSRQLQETLGAREPNQGGMAQDILSARFQQEPSWGDISKGIMTTLESGKTTSGQDIADSRMSIIQKMQENRQKQESGGATGFLAQKLMDEAAANGQPMSFADALYSVQTGMRQGTQYDENGNIVVRPGYAGAKATIAGAQRDATNLSDQNYEPTTARLTQDQKNQSDINAAPQIKAGGELGTGFGKQVSDLRQSALDAQDALYLNTQARGLLDKGIISGAGANGLAKYGAALKQIGINFGEDDVSNTQAFIASRAQAVGQKIRMFGSGTGLSDNDRIYAETMAAGRINLTEQAIRKILEMDDKSSQRTIGKYNSQLSKLPETMAPADMSLPNDTTGGFQSSPPNGKLIGTSGGKKVYELPNGSHVMEQ